MSEVEKPFGLAPPDPWAELRRFTQARIALGSVGASLPTAEVLGFSLAHARARDAVWLPLDAGSLGETFLRRGFAVLRASSQAKTRLEYLGRPDLGRCLDPQDLPALVEADPTPRHRLTIVVADGLSSMAVTRHALALVLELRSLLTGWEMDAVIVATQARVALGDDIGAARKAEAVVVLIGERPGLSSPDSLGIYMTYGPRPGRADSERNCISNVRQGGLSYGEAARKLSQLLTQARLAGTSGVSIKDRESMEPHPRALP